MTIKEMISKIKVYNEVATVLGENKIALEINDYISGCSVRTNSIKGTDYREIKKAIKEIYIDEVVDFMLTYDGFEFDTDVVVNMGENFVETNIVYM